MAVVFCVIIYSNYYIQCFQSVIFYVYVKVNKEVYADTYSDFLKIDPNLTKSPANFVSLSLINSPTTESNDCIQKKDQNDPTVYD
jgi:hypothetical protein